MKSEHRHELKTNELAEWLSNLPQWTKENLTTIVVISAVIVVAAAFYIRHRYSKTAVAEEQLEFTNLLNQLSASKMQVLNAQAQGRDLSFILLQPANSLGNFAQTAKSDQMAALALIKQAEALRTELHYRPGTVSEQDLMAQINQAKAAYTEAIHSRLKRTSNPSLMAAAEFGLGLCEEELGNFEKAQQIYQVIAENPDFEGAVAVAQAKHRLETMADYKQKVIFKPAPALPDTSLLQSETDFSELIRAEGLATKPTIQIKPVDTNLPLASSLPPATSGDKTVGEANLPIDVNQASQTPIVLPEVNLKVPDPNDPNVSIK
jgi:tetratricopeptide (TPR) repeat protein